MGRPPPQRLCGLSPRVRGKRGTIGAGGRRNRSIPACAGEAGRHDPAAGPDRVYPRVCGGSVKAIVRPQVNDGLSPRVRGKPLM